MLHTVPSLSLRIYPGLNGSISERTVSNSWGLVFVPGAQGAEADGGERILV